MVMRMCIFYTSGTTGRIYGAIDPSRLCYQYHQCRMHEYNFGNALARANGTEDQLPAPGEAPAVALVTSPLFHVTANNAHPPATMAGGKLRMGKWDAGEALRLIEKEKINSVGGVPVMARELIPS